MGLYRNMLCATVAVCVAVISSSAAATVTDTNNIESPRVAPDSRSEQVGDISALSLEHMLDIPTTVATGRARSLRESPAVMTVLTRNELLDAGVEDLLGALQLVAGFSFGQDVENVVGLAFRGQWAHEAKALLLIDGMELNEILYGNNALGNHITTEDIDHIEIIRGPGSAVYGGEAELAVINVVTRNAASIQGISASIYYGQYLRSFGHRNVHVAYGQVFDELDGLKLTISATLGEGVRSDGLFLSKAVSTYRGSDGNSDINPASVKLAVVYKDLRLRFMYDNYRMSETRALPLAFISYFLDFQYDIHVLPTLTITPHINIKQQQPWQSLATTPNAYDFDAYLDITTNRSYANVTAAYDVIPGINALAGLQATFDEAHVNMGPGGIYNMFSNTPFDSAGDTWVAYQNYAAFAQVLFDTEWVNFTLGARYEMHSFFGSSFVPRLGLTKVIGDFHFKLLASQSFRAPTIENINVNPQITPEKTNNLELELGYVLSDTMFISGNLFYLQINQPIAYAQVNGNDTYFNFPSTGSIGAEIEFRYKSSWATLTANASHSTAAGLNQVPIYDVPQTRNALMGIPRNKIVVYASFNAGDHFVFGPSLVALGQRYGYLGTDGTVGVAHPTVLLNLFVTYRNLGLDQLDLGLGLYNILGQEFGILQAYASGYPPIPAMPREAAIRLSYNMR